MKPIAYNRALDHVVLSMDQYSKGNHTLAARLFAKAMSMADAPKAIRILEASNRAAFASAKPAVKPTKAVSAAARLTAGEGEDMEGEGGDFPGFEDMQHEGGDEPIAAVAEDDPVSDIEEEDEEEDENPAATMAAVLASLVPKKSAPKVKK